MQTRTSEQLLNVLKESLREYGIVNKSGEEITDEQVLELCDLFTTGFTLLVNEFQKIVESVTVIFNSIGVDVDRLGLVVSDEERKKNED